MERKGNGKKISETLAVACAITAIAITQTNRVLAKNAETLARRQEAITAQNLIIRDVKRTYDSIELVMTAETDEKDLHDKKYSTYRSLKGKYDEYIGKDERLPECDRNYGQAMQNMRVDLYKDYSESFDKIVLENIENIEDKEQLKTAIEGLEGLKEELGEEKELFLEAGDAYRYSNFINQINSETEGYQARIEEIEKEEEERARREAEERAAASRRVANEMAARGGMVGRIYIDGYNAALISGIEQYIVDAYDSACWYELPRGIMFVGDHAYQGLNVTYGSGPGSVMYVDYGSGRVRYVCTFATNWDTSDYWYRVWNNVAPFNFSGGIMTQTCINEAGTYDRICHWVQG